MYTYKCVFRVTARLSEVFMYHYHMFTFSSGGSSFEKICLSIYLRVSRAYKKECASPRLQDGQHSPSGVWAMKPGRHLGRGHGLSEQSDNKNIVNQ